jgi:hypothetical protein
VRQLTQAMKQIELVISCFLSTKSCGGGGGGPCADMTETNTNKRMLRSGSVPKNQIFAFWFFWYFWSFRIFLQKTLASDISIVCALKFYSRDTGKFFLFIAQLFVSLLSTLC